MCKPQLLNLLIVFLEERQEMWKGYLYVILLGLTSFLIGVFDSWYWKQVGNKNVPVIVESIKYSLCFSVPGRPVCWECVS